MNGKGQTVRLWSPTIPNSRNYVPSNYYIWPARFSRPISRMERILRRIAVSISLFRFDKRYVEYTHWEKHGFDFPCNSNFFPFCSLSCSLFVCLCLSLSPLLSCLERSLKLNIFTALLFFPFFSFFLLLRRINFDGINCCGDLNFDVRNAINLSRKYKFQAFSRIDTPFSNDQD